MKTWQLLDVIDDRVIAESNEYMELYEMRNELLKNYTDNYVSLVKYYKIDADVQCKWLICNEKSKFFKKRL